MRLTREEFRIKYPGDLFKTDNDLMKIIKFLSLKKEIKADYLK